MVKISKRVAGFIVVASAIALIVIVNCYVLFPSAFTLPKGDRKLAVSDLKIEPSDNWQSSNIRLVVTNTYNSPITVIGSRVNGVSFGYAKMEVPPGQTQDVILSLSNLRITNSTSYDTELTFTFDDGKYEVYPAAITPKKYVGALMINGQSMNGTSNSTIYFLAIQNTGNIPLVSAKCTIGNYTASLPLGGNLMPQSTITLDLAIPFTYDKGEAVTATLEATFAEGSTFSSQSTFTFG